MNLSGTTSFLSAFDDNVERRDAMLRALTGELSSEEQRAFEASLTPREETEYRALERLTTLIKPSVVGQNKDNLFFEQQWRILMSQNQAFTDTDRAVPPVLRAKARHGGHWQVFWADHAGVVCGAGFCCQAGTLPLAWRQT